MANPLSALLVTPFLLKLLPFLVKLYFKTEAQLGCTDETWEPTYDYIIVGSGPAGSVLANRLSEDPHRTVLLIESGPTFHKLAEVPGLEILFPGTAYTDSYKTVAQEKSCFGMPKRQCQFSFGRGLGGSTNIDTSIYTRGSPQEYDSWTKLGLRNWRYELNVPYFQMIEKKGSYYDATYHGSPSVIPIEPDPFENLVTRTVKSGAKELNIPSDASYSGAYLSTPMMIQKGGSRYSAYRSYVEPIKSRPNLRIVTCAQVTKINVFNYRAVSVTVERHGSVDTIHANKEIIISGDPISTPKLLMLSGIGPKKLLIKHDISPVMPLEGVGENLVSPICTFALNYALKDMKESELYQDFDLDNIMRYENNGTGRFATTGFDVIGQFPSQVYGYNETGHWPDLQLMLYTGGLVTKDGIWAQRKYGIDHRTWKTVFHPYVNSPSFTLMVCLARPLSRGVVEITSSHHSGPMMINPRYNDHPTDLQAITNGLKLALKLGNTQALRAIGTRIYRSVIPSCREYAIYSDPYLACAAQTLVFPSTYMAGTCRMGHPEDPMSVVNPQLQVKGVNGLRIADSSVLPTRPALSSAPEYLIGEKLFGYLTNRKPPIYAVDSGRPVSKPY